MDLYDTSTFAEALEGSDYIFYTHPLQARADRARRIRLAQRQEAQERRGPSGAWTGMAATVAAFPRGDP